MQRGISLGEMSFYLSKIDPWSKFRPLAISITGQAGLVTTRALARDEILLMDNLVFQVDFSPSQIQGKCL